MAKKKKAVKMPVKKHVKKCPVSKKPRRITKKIARQPKRAKHVKKIAKKPAAPAEKKIFTGTISHYFTEIGVGVVELVGPLENGNAISIEGTTTNIRQKADSMQINRKPVLQAKKGDVIGLKVKGRVREGDRVYLVE